MRSQSHCFKNVKTQNENEKNFNSQNEKVINKKIFNAISENNKINSINFNLIKSSNQKFKKSKPKVKKYNNNLISLIPTSRNKKNLKIKTNILLFSCINKNNKSYKSLTNKTNNNSIIVDENKENNSLLSQISNNSNQKNCRKLSKKRNNSNKLTNKNSKINTQSSNKSMINIHQENKNKSNNSNTKNNKKLKKIIFIQRWWRTINSIILIQKIFRGFLFRIKNIYKYKIKVSKKLSLKRRNIITIIHRIKVGKKLLNSSFDYQRKKKLYQNFSNYSDSNIKKIPNHSYVKLSNNDNSKNKINNQFIITSQFNFSIIDNKNQKEINSFN
jgi:hypothetical protein